MKWPLLLVEWADSCSHGDDWHQTKNLDDADFTAPIHHSVGWELKRTDKALTLAPNLGMVGDERNECVCCHFTIPLAVIQRETVLRKGSA